MIRNFNHASSTHHRTALLGMKFPLKLWTIIDECSTNAIRWGSNGRTVIFEYKTFQQQYLNDEIMIFKTNNITSFVRQLNLYGFRKIYRSVKAGAEETHEFQHPLFLRDRRDLVTQIRRKTGARSSKLQIANVYSNGSQNQDSTTQVQKYHAVFQEALNRQKNINEETKPAVQRNIPLQQYPNPHPWTMMKKVIWNYPPMMANPYVQSPAGPFPGALNQWGPSEAEFYAPQAGMGDFHGAHQMFDKHFGFENAEKVDTGEASTSNQDQVDSVPNPNNFYFLLMGDPSMGGHAMYPGGGYYDATLPIAGMPVAQSAVTVEDGGTEPEDQIQQEMTESDNIFANLGYLT